MALTQSVNPNNPNFVMPPPNSLEYARMKTAGLIPSEKPIVPEPPPAPIALGALPIEAHPPLPADGDPVVASAISLGGLGDAGAGLRSQASRAAREAKRVAENCSLAIMDGGRQAAAVVRNLFELRLAHRTSAHRAMVADAMASGVEPPTLDLDALRTAAAADAIEALVTEQRGRMVMLAVTTMHTRIVAAVKELDTIRDGFRGQVLCVLNPAWNGGSDATELHHELDNLATRERRLSADLDRWRAAYDGFKPALAKHLGVIVDGAGGVNSFALAIDPVVPASAERDATTVELQRRKAEIEGELHKFSRTVSLNPSAMKQVAGLALAELDARIQARHVELAPTVGLVDAAMTGEPAAFAKVLAVLSGTYPRGASVHLTAWIEAAGSAFTESDPSAWIEVLSTIP